MKITPQDEIILKVMRSVARHLNTEIIFNSNGTRAITRGLHDPSEIPYLCGKMSNLFGDITVKRAAHLLRAGLAGDNEVVKDSEINFIMR